MKMSRRVRWKEDWAGGEFAYIRALRWKRPKARARCYRRRKKRLFEVERRRILIRNQRQQAGGCGQRRFPGTAQEARGAYVRLLYTPGCGRKKKTGRQGKREEKGPSATEALIFLDESPPELRLAQQGGLSGVFFLVRVFGFFFSRLCVLSFVVCFFLWIFFSAFVSFTLFPPRRVEREFRRQGCRV
ncbi:hypothetical protein J3F84DRAFT_371222 [Trichoderma pleuroticola]